MLGAMFGRPEDSPSPPDPGAPPPLDRFALARAVQALRYLDQFHTRDVARHPLTLNAHRDLVDAEDFVVRVEAWLTRQALFLGLRGPLPGHPARGARWAWQVATADVTQGEGLVGSDPTARRQG